MRSLVLAKLLGYVRIQVRGERCEQLVNEAVRAGLDVWDVRRKRNGQAELVIRLRDYFRLKPFLRRTGCRTRVVGRFGLPFVLARLERRLFFGIGMLLFVAGIYVLSSLVWTVDVEGNQRLSRTEVLQAAKGQGMYPWQWKHRLPENDVLARQLHSALPGVSWVGIEIHGTSITIRVVEATQPDARPLMNPRDLVASGSAEVTRILAVKGRPAVKPGTVVKKGDLLIAGTLGDGQTVVAEGTVLGKVWHQASVEVPMETRLKVYTGDVKRRDYMILGNRVLQLYGFGGIPYPAFETKLDQTVVEWRKWRLPVSWLRESVMAVEYTQTTRTLEEARALGLDEARAEVLRESGAQSGILQEKILHEKADSGKVYMEVLFEIEQPIGEERPLIPSVQGE
ncbi:sporulation protein YqfD [Paenibacillus sp. y28]|uniref:sporulation protein YqfD n=1 Tax=Paenibacillus sp. y28 TaxID=3129110 RepID=UPI0030167BC9